ncbi:MAG: nucleotidyltransferase domain-containing protein [Desulfurococcales archaeon]|nr:nucleotidyltransferase domain-containing protein [Desulfurococcales archaeon]
MVREKISRIPEYREVVYDKRRWKLFHILRQEAYQILNVLDKNGIRAIVHGSIARGDVWEHSDIDVFIPTYIPSYKIEYILESHGYHIRARYIVVATPNSTPKAYIVLDDLEERIVSFPLAKMQVRELEFYAFGGQVDLDCIRKGVRVPGVDKRLVLIEPTVKGHKESPVIGRESEVAEILGISIDTVLERIRVLTRRDKIGRTGVFVKHVLAPDESFESALDSIARKNPWVRRVLDERVF